MSFGTVPKQNSCQASPRTSIRITHRPSPDAVFPSGDCGDDDCPPRTLYSNPQSSCCDSFLLVQHRGSAPSPYPDTPGAYLGGIGSHPCLNSVYCHSSSNCSSGGSPMGPWIIPALFDSRNMSYFRVMVNLQELKIGDLDLSTFPARFKGRLAQTLWKRCAYIQPMDLIPVRVFFLTLIPFY